MADNSRIVKMGLTGAIAIAAALVMPSEGLHYKAYLDPPGIATICFGHSGKDVHIGQKANDDDCVRLLKKDLDEANAVIDRNVKVPLPDTRRAALLDFIYNSGGGNFSRSTLLKRLNSGRTEEACNELTKWVYAGGKKLDGLVRRRAAEKTLCMEGLNAAVNNN